MSLIKAGPGRGAFRGLWVMAGILFLGFGIAASAPWWLGAQVRKAVEQSLEIRLNGTLEPVFLKPAFNLRGAGFTWEGRVRLISGDVSVRYDPFFLLKRGNLRVRISGEALQIRLEGDWAKLQGVTDAQLEHLTADLGLDRSGVREIYAMDVKSSQFQFQIVKSENIIDLHTRRNSP